MSTDTLLERFPGKRFVEVAAPSYSPDGRFALLYLRGFYALPGDWAQIAFERREAGWTATGCGLRITG
jgi:hypothetical protein